MASPTEIITLYEPSQRIPRATYDTLKANCAARIEVLMQRHNLTPAAVQQRTKGWVIAGEETVAVTMQDLYQYRSCRALPSRAKLRVLAKVLECDPEELLPEQHQQGSVGRRRVYQGLPQHKNDIRTSVEPLPLVPGYAQLEITNAILPVETAHKIRTQLERLHRIEEMRRMGMNDEQIKEYLAGGTSPEQAG